MHYFGLFSIKFENPQLNFRFFWRKTIVLENIEKDFTNFFDNRIKLPFLSIFNEIPKPSIKFARVLRKTIIIWEFLRKLSKISWEMSKKSIILAYSQPSFKILSLLFRAFGRYIQSVGKFWENFKFLDKNSLEMLNIYLFLENLLLQIEPSDVSSFFQHFFQILVGGRSRCSPWRSHWKSLSFHLWNISRWYMFRILRSARVSSFQERSLYPLQCDHWWV